MSNMTYYQALGLSSQATDDEIKDAFRKISSRCHPDRNPDPKRQEEFRLAAEAYKVLKDPKAKAGYDETLSNQLVEDFSSVAQDSWNNFINQSLKGI